MSSGIPAGVRAAVLERDFRRCQWCGRPVNVAAGHYSLQHRRARGMGGSRRATTASPANLVTVCGSATTECHGWIEAHPDEARDRGFRISASADPARVPIIDPSGRAWMLAHDGDRHFPGEVDTVP